MTKSLAKVLLKLWGFRVNFIPLDKYPKLLYVVVPHTSGWDFPLGVLVRTAYDLKIQFVGKKALFDSWYGPLFKKLGGLPVDRSGGLSQVDAIVNLINSKKEIGLSIAPEGTRKKVDKLKTGFLHIARNANIPIILITFDFENKVVGFSDPYYLSDDLDAEMKKVEDHFRGVQGKVPEYSFNPEK